MSLVTAPVRELSVCPTCASTRVITITMTLTDGSVVDFSSCHHCETRTWTESGTGLAVTEVLRKAQKPTKQA